ncbi:MAG: hypothetical protein E1N59_567 [Puniceicoccaceae bacterium 5H]|nr:MAG: hypothetical protein E1N59_567 [Puniceicoccaceae bacterium 5H]
MNALLASRQNADALLKRGRPGDLRTAATLLASVIDSLHPRLWQDGDDATRFELGCAWINYGNALLRLDNREHLLDASEAYRQAIHHLDQLAEPLPPAYRVERSAAWANLAHTLQLPEDPTSWEAARRCYQTALDALKGLPPLPRYLHRLAGTWLNLANCDQLLGKHEEAITAYRQAENVLADHEHHEPGQSFDGLRLRIWLNRANTLAQLEEPEADRRALDDLDRAIAGLRTQPDQSFDLAQALANQANLRTRDEADVVGLQAGLAAAREAWKGSQDLAFTSLKWAEVSLQAFRAALQCLTLLVPRLAETLDTDTLYFEASDLADEAMELFRHWQATPQAQLWPIGRRIFHLGTQLYAHAQPQFLPAFLFENLQSGQAPFAMCADRELRASAAVALDTALHQLRYERQVSLDHAEVIFHLIRQLERTREDLGLA